MRRLPALLPVTLLLAVTTACTAASGPGEETPSPAQSSSAATEQAGDSPSPAPSPSASPTASQPSPGPDEVVVGCTDTQARDLGDVVAGVDVDGDGAKDVIRFVTGDADADGGEDCARTVLAYLPDTIAGVVLGDGLELTAGSVESLAPAQGEQAYVRLRTDATDEEGYQEHLYALVGSGADARLAEVSAEGDDAPLLPFVAGEDAEVRAGFLCSDGSLVAQVGTAEDPDGTTWAVTTTTYAVDTSGDAARASVEDETTTTDVQDDALRFRFPALLEESAANLCS